MKKGFLYIIVIISIILIPKICYSQEDSFTLYIFGEFKGNNYLIYYKHKLIFDKKLKGQIKIGMRLPLEKAIKDGNYMPFEIYRRRKLIARYIDTGLHIKLDKRYQTLIIFSSNRIKRKYEVDYEWEVSEPFFIDY